MNRGTLMVLKRILVTTLSALGLGALAAGTASGQTAGDGNIPAPNIFDDQIQCSMFVPGAMNTPMPTVVPMGGMTSPLDDLINGLGMGTYQLTAANVTAQIADDAMTANVNEQDVALATLNTNLGYVIPATGMNCGLGAGMGPTLGTMNIDAGDGMGGDPDGDFLDVGDTLAWGDVPKDVADGYSDLLTKFIAVYGDPGGTTGGTARDLAAAIKAQSELPADASAGQRTAAQERVDTAQAAHNRAMAEYNAISAGLSAGAQGQSPIYKAGVAEWMAKAAVSQSIVDYNDAVMKAYGTDGGMAAATGGAKGQLDNMNYTSDGTASGTSKYVPLGATGNLLVGTVVTVMDGMATVVQTALANYVNRNLDQTAAAVDMDGVTTISASNFDEAGNLVVPMSLQDHDGDSATDEVLRPIVSATVQTVSAIRTVAENHELAAKALEKLRDENVNAVNQEVFDEAARRARLEANYYNNVLQTMLADTVDTRTDAQKLTFVDTNGNGVRDAGEDTNDNYEPAPITIASRHADYIAASNKRVAAEADLRAKVATREAATTAVRNAFNSPQDFYQQLVDRRTALKAAADKVVTDAQANGGTATEAQTKAASDAQKALMAANMAKSNLEDLFADENDPGVTLINELLKTGGDDGQALVDAISSNYDTANAAKTTADKVAEDVAGLTGDEGAVSQNTANIKTNADNIGKLDERVADNEAEIWDADGNSRIDANETRSMTNATNIATNTTNIATNAENIMGLRTDVDQNEEDIMTNAGNIMTNSGRLDTAEGRISSNADAIANNMNSIGQNQAAIGRNESAIMGLQDQMEVVRAGVAASMALAGMPAINGRGISIGVGSFDGESAFAVGFQIQSDMASFKVGVTSAGGETGASAGVGFQF